MLIWLRRGLLLGGLLFSAIFVILYFWSVSLLEAFAASYLEERKGEIEIESIRMSFAGPELRVQRYAEKSLLVEDVSIHCPWNQLWSLSHGVTGTVHVDRIRIQLNETNQAALAAESAVPFAVDPGKLAADLAALMDALPISLVEVVIDEFVVEGSGVDIDFGAEMSLLRGLDGETHFSAVLANEFVEVDARMKVLAAGEGLAIDFTLAAHAWDEFQSSYLKLLSEKWMQTGLEVYVNPLDTGRGFLEASGYARWLSSAPEQLNYTLLADMGAGEVYWPQGELLLQNTSAGWASDGLARTRAYVRGAVKSIRQGSWMESGGSWGLRLEDQVFGGELRVGEVLELSLAHDDWRQFANGSGTGRFYLETPVVDAELLRAFDLPALPDDLEFELAAHIEGEGKLEHWQLQTVALDVKASVQDAALSRSGLAMRNAEAQAQLSLSGMREATGSLQLNIADVNALGFTLNEIQIGLALDETGIVSLQPTTASTMGGDIRVGAMRLDLNQLDNFSFRARLNGIELTQLAEAVPQFKGEVSGKVSGYLIGAVRGGQPVLTDGRLEIDSDTGARLRYDVNGLLTQGMAEGSAAYNQYRMAELAFQDLALKKFSIDVFPQGNTTRPFRLELFGESLQGKTTVPVDFSLNVNVDDTASLLELLRMIQRGELDLN